MKKILAVLVACSIILMCTGCGGAEKNAATDDAVNSLSPLAPGADAATGGTEAVYGETGAADLESDRLEGGGMKVDGVVPSIDGIGEAPSGDSAGSIGDSNPIMPDPTTDVIGTTDSVSETTKPLEEAPIEAGILTAGEWNDNDNFDFWLNLFKTNNDWKTFQKTWKLNVTNRIKVTVTGGGKAVANASVKLYKPNGEVLWSAVSDNTGTAYLYAGIDTNSQDSGTKISVTYNDITVEQAISGYSDIAVEISDVQKKALSLDLMLVFDTTGSMGDELVYLQTELEDVIKTVQKENGNIPVRLSVNFYRDTEDEYVVKPFAFTDDITAAISELKAQSADGGGDTEEAVEMALDDAVNKHEWAQDSVKIMLMVLDAPPHTTDENAESLKNTLESAAEKGIRIVPVASSGVDKNTEFLLRSFAATTGGTYTFLTDDSGVGGAHIEPTIGKYEVEKLNEMLVRIIGEYLS